MHAEDAPRFRLILIQVTLRRKPSSVTFSIALLLALTLVALVLFALEIISADVIALALMLTLTLTGLLPPERAFAGFGSDTVIVILGLLILTAALLRTGVMDMVGRVILRHTGDSAGRLLIVVSIAAAGLGAFMSNTASTAFFLPVVFGLARRAKISPGKLLLPLAFAGIVSSSVSLISTSTNVVVSGLLQDYRLPPMGMFELAPVGIPVAVTGVIYLLTLGRRLVPDRFAGDAPDADPLGLRPYLAEIIILPDSPLVGKTLGDAALGRDLDLKVLRILRGEKRALWPEPWLVLQGGDILIVEGGSEEILKIKDVSGIEIKADLELSDPSLSPDELGLVEALVLPRSPLVGRTLKGYGFRERFGLQVLGISRHGEAMHHKISTVPLRIGDLLLLQGPRERLRAMESANVVRVIGAPEEERPRVRLAPVAIAIFLGVITLPTLKLVTLPVAVMLGVVAVFLTRCLTSTEAYREVRVEGGNPDCFDALPWCGDGAHRRRRLSCGESGPMDARARAGRGARRVLRAHGSAHTADVESSRGHRGAAHRDPNGPPARPESADLRHDDRRRRELLLSHATRTGVPHGLRARPLSLPRFRPCRCTAHAANLPDRHHLGAAFMAGTIG
jgi:di/tricarboxylate transporter